MIGKQQIVLDAATWLKGMSSGSEVSDGGFSDETSDVNLIADPGVLYAPTTASDADTDVILDDEIIASCPDAAAGSPFDAMVMTDDGDFMTYNGTKLADVTGGQDTTRTYTKGTSDMVPWLGRIYFTSQEQLGEWQLPSTFNFTFSALANTAADPPHPLLVFENNLYIADGNLLKRMTTVGGTVSTILTLGTNEFITALGIDPGTGKMLIATSYGQNASDTIARTNKILWYDGFSNKVSKSVIVEDRVTALHTHGGVTYVGYGISVGYLNGSGITFMRRLGNMSLAQAELPYKHNFASIGRTMYIIDGASILARGPIIGEQSIWYYAFENQTNTNKYQAIFNAGNNKLGLSFATTKFRTLDVTSKASLGTWDFYTNWLVFPRPVQIRSIDIHFNEAIVSSANWAFAYFDQSSTSAITSSLASLHGTQTSVTELNDIVGFTNKLSAFKLYINVGTSTENKGIKRIIIRYDFVE